MLALISVLKHAYMLRHMFHHLQIFLLKDFGKEGNVANAKHKVML